MTTADLMKLGPRFQEILPDGTIMRKAAIRLINEYRHLKLYTLSVIDEDGSITGKKGAILAPSKEIPCPIRAKSIKDLAIGEGIWIWKTNELPRKHDHTPKIYDGRVFELTVCAAAPGNIVDRCEAFWIWRRIK